MSYLHSVTNCHNWYILNMVGESVLSAPMYELSLQHKVIIGTESYLFIFLINNHVKLFDLYKFLNLSLHDFSSKREAKIKSKMCVIFLFLNDHN